MKRCSKCGIEKEEEHFNKDRSKEDGLVVWCKPCTSKYNKDHNSKPEVKEAYKKRRSIPKAKEAKREYQKKYDKERNSNPIIKAARKERNSKPENKEAQKKRYSNPEVKAAKKEYRTKPEVKAARQKRRKDRKKQTLSLNFVATLGVSLGLFLKTMVILRNLKHSNFWVPTLKRSKLT